MSAADPLIEARDLVKTFGKVPAVSGLNLRLMRGDLYGLVGLNGAGKTTTLRMITGLIAPTSGTLAFGGTVTSRVRPRHRARLAALIDTPSLFPRLSGLENVLAIARLSGPLSVRDASNLLDEVGLHDRGHHYPSQLSGGEQQRVAIARALANDPPLVLADEPTGNLDSMNGRHILELLLQVRRTRHVTLVIVTHDATVAAVADARLVLRDGRAVSDVGAVATR